MISIVLHTASIVSQMAAVGTTDGALTQTQLVLSTIDGVVFVTAVGLVLGLIVRLVAEAGRRSRAEGTGTLTESAFSGSALRLTAAPQRPNRLREDSLALALMVYLLCAAAISGLVKLAVDEPDGVLATVLTGAGAHAAGIGVCLIIAARQFDGGVRRFWFAENGARFRTSLIITIVLTIAAVGLCPTIHDAAVSVILRLAPDYVFAPHPTIEALQGTEQPIGVIIALWAAAVVIAPISEELFFRGLLQTFLVRLLHSRWLAVGVASLIFGAVHFQQPQAIPALALLGLLMGYAYERTGSLLPAILIHALFNLKTLIWDALN